MRITSWASQRKNDCMVSPFDEEIVPVAASHKCTALQTPRLGSQRGPRQGEEGNFGVQGPQ